MMRRLALLLATALLAAAPPAQNDTPAPPSPSPDTAGLPFRSASPTPAAYATWRPALPPVRTGSPVLTDAGGSAVRPSRAGAAVGAAVGGIAGLVVGIGVFEECDDCDRSIAPALGFGALGALGGAFVGWVVGKLMEPVPPDASPAR